MMLRVLSVNGNGYRITKVGVLVRIEKMVRPPSEVIQQDHTVMERIVQSWEIQRNPLVEEMRQAAGRRNWEQMTKGTWS